MSALRILVTTSTLPRWLGDAMPAFVLDQAIALTRALPGARIEILAPHHAGAAFDEVMHGIPIHRFRYFWPPAFQRLAYSAMLPGIRRRPWLALQLPAFIVAQFFAILSQARRFRPTVIYSHWFMPQALAGSLAARLLGIPHVFTTHSSDVEVLRFVPLLGPALVRLITRSSHACTAVSRRTAGRLEAFFDRAEWQALAPRLQIIPMGVNLAELADKGSAQKAAARQALGLGESPVLLFLGRLTEKKGLGDLLQAAAELQRRHHPFSLVIAGEGPLRPEIESQIGQLDLGKTVRMAGFVSGQTKQDYLTASDVVVVPSIVTAAGDVEGLPVTLMEGMAAGRICVASDESGADDVITNGVDGFIVPAGDPNALAAALASVLKLDPSAVSDMSKRAAARMQVLDWAPVATAHYSHLFAALDPDPAAPARAGMDSQSGSES